MSTKKTTNGTGSSSNRCDLGAAVAAIRRLPGDGDQVTLTQLIAESGLEAAAVEQAMDRIERVSPLRKKQSVLSSLVRLPGGVTVGMAISRAAFDDDWRVRCPGGLVRVRPYTECRSAYCESCRRSYGIA